MVNAPDTPFISLDLNCIKQNIDRMQAKADEAGLILRPHAKTHKSVNIARMQIEAGARGLTVAKPEEAITFIKNNISPIMICYPVISDTKIIDLLTIADQYNAEILFVLDSLYGFNILNQSALTTGKTIKTYIEIDVGLKRCGLPPDSETLLNLAQQIHNTGNLTLTGLTSHAGQSYSAGNKIKARIIAEQERTILLNVKEKLEQAGIAITELCVGSTPTLWAQQNFENLTEIKPGNYIFNDLTQKNIGVANWNNLALSVITTVVSSNDNYLIVDAGSKTLTSDAGAHGTQGVSGYGLTFKEDALPDDTTGLLVEKLSEEHGWIRHNGNPVPLGTRLRIYPNHACPVVNLFDKLHIYENNQHTDTWPVDARGCVH